MTTAQAPDSVTEVLHLIHGLTIGGAEIDLLHKCAYLVKTHNYRMTICCLLRRGELANAFEAAGITVIGPLMRHRYDSSVGWRLRRLLADPRWDWIHGHLAAANLIGWAIRQTLPRSQRTPFLAAEHAMADRWPPWVHWLDRQMTQAGVPLVMPTAAMAASYHAIGIDKRSIIILPNCVDSERFQKIDRAAARRQIRHRLHLDEKIVLIGTVCRLEAVKLLPVLFEAIAPLAVQLVIVGDGRERDQLTALLAERQQTAQVHLVGSQTNVPEWLAAFDLFVLPSHSESFGLVVAEALLMETPVIATAVGGIPEITGDGDYATLVPPGDVVALRDAIAKQMADPAEGLRQAQAGRAYIEANFAVARCAEQLHNLYQQLGR